MVDPLDMIVGPEMVVDYVLSDGSGIIVAGSKKLNSAITPSFGPNGSSIIINGTSAPSQVRIFTAKGAKIGDHFITPERNSIPTGNCFSRQILIVEVVSNVKKSTHAVLLK